MFQNCERKRESTKNFPLRKRKCNSSTCCCCTAQRRKYPAENYSSTLSLPLLKLLLQKFLTFPPANSFERLFFTGCTLVYSQFSYDDGFPSLNIPNQTLPHRTALITPSPLEVLSREHTFNSTLPPRTRGQALWQLLDRKVYICDGCLSFRVDNLHQQHYHQRQRQQQQARR